MFSKTKAAVHHTGVLQKANSEQFDAIKRNHALLGRGADSAYHFFIESDGTRKKGRDIALVSFGTRNKKVNQEYIQICLAGNFEEEEPTEAQINALSDLLIELGIEEVIGHRDASASACPGKNLYKLLDRIIVPKWARGIALDMESAGIETSPTDKIKMENGETMPLYQAMLMVRKLYEYWKD